MGVSLIKRVKYLIKTLNKLRNIHAFNLALVLRLGAQY